ncbi:1-acyl-sn-glycerol-3-phosphate acyltransferase [Gilvibacter sp.]|uniref:1-acyl-sn-glycerol-3-phosphate acyltransferase n=1 Tax=Gilvibacter sp. TaxID=2729997 RepID=UPI0035BE7657
MWFTKFIFHKVMGWKIQGSFDPEVKKSVVLVVPHTHWHDFTVGAYARRILKTKIHFVGKKELFKWPMGAYFRWMGGYPLDRTSGQNKVEAIAAIFDKHEEFRMAIAPEGTRKKVDSWKTGYFYIAMAAKVPIIAVAFDYKTKTVVVHPPYTLTGDLESDTAALMAKFRGVVGKIPEYTQDF